MVKKSEIDLNNMSTAATQALKQERTPPFLIAGRLAMLALALCAASFLNSFSNGDVQSWIFIALGVLFAANLLLVIWFKLAPNSVWLKRVQSGLDIGIVTGIIFCTGGISSPYLFLYLPVLFLTRISGTFKNSIATAAVTITSYILAAYWGSSDHGSSEQFIQALTVQVIILAASVSLVVFSAQYLMQIISNKDAQVTRSKLDLLEQAKNQIQLLEKLPYGVISLNSDLIIVRANSKAADLLKKELNQLIDKPLSLIISEFAKTAVTINRERGKLQLLGLPAALFSYEFLDASVDNNQQRFFIFQEGLEDSTQSNPNLSQLEERLRELLTSNSSAGNDCEIASLSSRTFIAESTVMKKVFSLIERTAPSDATVLIQGESGTGKELVARALHENSHRSNFSFVTVNCGAIPEHLIESTLFGHKKGAFTSAISDSMGLIREAQGGTLFLDEIGELPLHMQAKLLRVLQERTLRPVGGDRDFDVDVRIIAATNKNLRAALTEGTFRDDLFYRLNVINIPLPALRERKEDLPVLIHTFLKRLSDKEGSYLGVNIASDAMHLLLNYDYPGNVRELENILERSYVLGFGSILAEHLSDLTPQKSSQSNNNLPARHETRILEDDNLILPLSLDQVLDALEKKCMLLALEKTQGHRTKAAELLGINLRSFRYRAQKLGL